MASAAALHDAQAIAIVGMGCRFAGAQNAQEYWQLLLKGGSAFSRVPRERWDAAAFLSKERGALDASYTDLGAFLDDIETFPALALQIPPRRVEVMDPQHRLSLECALEAIADAGYRVSDLPRRTSVIMGVCASEFRGLAAARSLARVAAGGAFGDAAGAGAGLAAAVERILPARAYSAPGALANMAAAIVAQECGFQGPAYTVDAACASALVAVEHTVQRLRSKAIDVGLAGGVYLQLTPEHYVAFSEVGALSRSGRCAPLDASADGFLQGDGVGVVVLKRLADAERDGDRVYAVIRGIAANSDGSSEGPMTPSAQGQSDVIELALADAGLDPAAIGYVEAHGTATVVGDRTELEAIRRVFGAHRSGPLRLGSAKANVGHTMSAAAMAGLLRATLALYHGWVPPMAGFSTPNAAVGAELEVPIAPEPWLEANRAAGVSAFGFGGTNVHAILSNQELAARAPATQHELVLLSAADLQTLRQLARATALALQADVRTSVAGVARALAVRPAQRARLALVTDSLSDLIAQLASFSEAGPASGLCYAEWAGGTATGEQPSAAPTSNRKAWLFAQGRGWTMGAACDVQAFTARAPVASLPPLPLPRERYWIVGHEARRPDFAGLSAETRVAPEAAAKAMPAPADDAVSHDVEREVIRMVAAAGSYPESSVALDSQLMADLGFDSLMLVELSTLLEATYGVEAAQRVPEDREIRVRDVVAALAGAKPLASAAVAAQATAAPLVPAFELRPEHTDPTHWGDAKDLRMRLQTLQIYGIRNPYFRQHEGTPGATTTVAGRQLINFDTYNYLGYSGDERVIADVVQAITRHGTSASASRVASGERRSHRELEQELAEVLDVDDALLFTAGHATNVAVIGRVMGSEDLVLHDELAHDSILQGAKLSGAARRAFRHGDVMQLREILSQERARYRKVLIAVEGVYSMDGDICDLPAIVELKREHGCLLLVDEAHSFGVLGKRGLGVREHFGLSGADVDLWMGTLSKSLASCGGWVAGSRAMIDFLRYSAGGFVYSAGMTPQNTQAALSSLRLLLREPERVERLQQNAAHFFAGCSARKFDTGHARGKSAIVPIIIGDSGETLLLAQRLYDAGINVSPIVHPAVAEPAARLRFFLSSLHDTAQLDAALETIEQTRVAVRSELARRRSAIRS